MRERILLSQSFSKVWFAPQKNFSFKMVTFQRPGFTGGRSWKRPGRSYSQLILIILLIRKVRHTEATNFFTELKENLNIVFSDLFQNPKTKIVFLHWTWHSTFVIVLTSQTISHPSPFLHLLHNLLSRYPQLFSFHQMSCIRPSGRFTHAILSTLFFSRDAFLIF